MYLSERQGKKKKKIRGHSVHCSPATDVSLLGLRQELQPSADIRFSLGHITRHKQHCEAKLFYVEALGTSIGINCIICFHKVPQDHWGEDANVGLERKLSPLRIK